jgi:hypothetical protein
MVPIGDKIPTPTAITATPTTYTGTTKPQIHALSPATIASTTMLPPFGVIQRALPQPEPLVRKRKIKTPRPVWVPSGTHSPASVGAATDGSVHFASPPTTPDDSPGQSEPKNASAIATLEEVDEDEDEEERVPKFEDSAPIAISKKKVGPRRKVRSPSPDADDPADPGDEFSRPSILTLRPWEEENGTTSMVQDYRILIHGRLHVGKVQTEW